MANPPSPEDFGAVAVKPAAPRPEDFGAVAQSDRSAQIQKVMDAGRTMDASVVRGFRDTTQGIMQLGGLAANKLGLISDATYADLNKYVDDSLKSYEAEHGGKPGSTTGRLIGGIVSTGPVNAIPGGGAGAPFALRLASNAAKGGSVGATQATGEGDSRTWNTAVGIGAGGAIPEVVRILGNVLSKPVNWLAQKSGLVQPGGTIGPSYVTKEPGFNSKPELTPEAQAELKSAGIDWNALGDEVKRNLYESAQKASTGLALKPAEAVRNAQANSLPVKVPMSQGNLSQDFAQNQFEAETAKNALAGKPLQELQTSQSNAFRDNFKALQDRIAKAPAGEQDTGKSVVGALEQGRASLKGVVDQAYQAAREDPAIGNQVSMQPVRQWLTENKSVFGTVKELGSAQAELKRLGAMGPGTKPLTVENVEQYRQFLNTLRQSPDARVQKFVGDLIDKVDESVMSSGNSDLFKNARFAAALKNATYKDQGIVSKLLDMSSRTDRAVPYEDVWKTTVVNSDINSLKQLKNTLMTGLQSSSVGKTAWADMQGQTLQYLEDAAKSASVGESGAPIFNPNKFAKALDNIGPDKLKVLFGNEAETLYNLRDVMKSTLRPEGSVNRSNTSSALGNMVQRVLGSIGGTVVGGITGGGMGAAAGAAMGAKASTALQDISTLSKANKAVNAVPSLSLQNNPGSRIGELLIPGVAQPAALEGVQKLRELAPGFSH